MDRAPSLSRETGATGDALLCLNAHPIRAATVFLMSMLDGDVYGSLSEVAKPVYKDEPMQRRRCLISPLRRDRQLVYGESCRM